MHRSLSGLFDLFNAPFLALAFPFLPLALNLFGGHSELFSYYASCLAQLPSYGFCQPTDVLFLSNCPLSLPIGSEIRAVSSQTELPRWPVMFATPARSQPFLRFF